MVALVSFKRGSFGMSYSYKTNITDLTEGDLLLVQTENDYSIATFYKYTNIPTEQQKATKYIVQKLDVKDFENKLFLGEM